MRAIKLTLILVVLITGPHAAIGQTDGSVTFQVTTTTNSGQYAPDHVLAIWITTASGTYVRTMERRAVQRIQYLIKWKQANPSMSVTDAVTGATAPSHVTHTIIWNLRYPGGGALVADGDYTFWIEFSESNAQGPYTSYTFTKDDSVKTMNFSNTGCFTNASIVYTPIVGVKEQLKQQALTYPNPFTDLVFLTIPVNMADNAVLNIYDFSGRHLFTINSYCDVGSNRVFYWNAGNATEGIYLYQIESGADIYNGRIMKLR